MHFNAINQPSYHFHNSFVILVTLCTQLHRQHGSKRSSGDFHPSNPGLLFRMCGGQWPQIHQCSITGNFVQLAFTNDLLFFKPCIGQESAKPVVGGLNHGGLRAIAFKEQPQVSETYSAKAGLLSTTPKLLLDRRTLHRTERTKNATVTGIGAQQRFAMGALVEKLAGIRRHRFLLG